MADTTILAWTEPTPAEGYPAYVSFTRTDDGKCYITVRGRGNGGRDQGCIEVSPQVLESLQNDLCEWLYRDDVDRLMCPYRDAPDDVEEQADAEPAASGVPASDGETLSAHAPMDQQGREFT